MHNGGIPDFHLIKRRLQAALSDDIYNVVQGNTGEYNILLISNHDYIF